MVGSSVPSSATLLDQDSQQEEEPNVTHNTAVVGLLCIMNHNQSNQVQVHWRAEWEEGCA